MAKIEEVLAANIKSLRKARGLTQEKLSERAGMSLTGLQGIEYCLRWPSPDTVRKITSALGVPEGALFQDLSAMPKPSAQEALEVITEAILRPAPAPTHEDELARLTAMAGSLERHVTKVRQKKKKTS